MRVGLYIMGDLEAVDGAQLDGRFSRLRAWIGSWPGREPLNAYSHFLGALIAVPGLILLLERVPLGAGARYYAALSIFGASLILLYSTSGLYHVVNGSKRLIAYLRRLDHMMIYILIAGTYTPICLLVLEGSWRWGLLIAVWSLALLGIIFKLVWFSAPRWLSTASYILMGWVAAIAFYPLSMAMSLAGMVSLILGGIFYSLGGVIYATKWPRLNLQTVGFHEIFHFLVLAGSLTHYIMVLQIL